MSGPRDIDSRNEIVVRQIPDPRRIARKNESDAWFISGMIPPPVVMPRTLRSRALGRVLDVISEGPIAGMHTSSYGGPFWNSVYLDDTPIQDAAGNFQFAIREGDLRYGFPGQSPIPGWPLSEASFAVGVEAKYLDPVVRSCNTPISAIRYVIRVQTLAHFEQDGDITENSVAYAFDVQIDGGLWTNYVTEAITGKALSPFERQVRVQLPFTTGSVNVRVIRLSPDDNGTEFQSKTFFSSYTEIVDGQIGYDDTALVSLTVDAEEFQSLPKRSFLIDGVMVDLPTNYNGRTHGYNGPWNGQFYTQWTNNPAWLLYAFLTNTRWGLGNFIEVGAIDKWSFYEAAVYCDGGVPDGKGSYEVRFTCNTVLNTRQDAYTVLQALASNMLCQLYYANGTIFLVQDRRLTVPERIFGPADVVEGIFEYKSADFRSRFNACAVTWNDPENKYETQVELVVDQELVSKQGYKETTTTAFGCTSRGQAQRLGRWLIYTSQYETEIVSFRVSIENADVRPGMLIHVSDPSLAGVRLAGRLLVEDRSNFVKLDNLPDELRADPRAWQIIFAIGSGADPHNRTRIYDHQVYAIEAGTDAVQINGKLEAFPEGSMWIAHAGAVEPMPFRVNTISDLGDGLYQITATQYRVEKFDFVEYGVKIPPPPYTLIPTGPLLPPSNFAYTEYIYADARGAPQFGVLLSWTASADPRVQRYQIEMSGPAGDYRKFGSVPGVVHDVPLMRHGEWLASIVSYDNLGRRSAPVSMTFVPIGLTARPLPPEAVFLAANGNTTTITWTPTNEIDVAYYWVKWTPEQDGATWERATTSISQVDGHTTQVITPTRSGTFMVKTIDSLGQESVSWAAAILTEQITDDVHLLDIREQEALGGVEYGFMGGAMPEGLTFARPSLGWYFDSAVTFASAAADVGRFDYSLTTSALRGLYNEAAATNLVRNSSTSGAVVGTPGTRPTYWSTSLGTALYAVTGTPIINGIQCVDIRFYGTTSSATANLIYFDATVQPFPENTQATESVYLALVGGSFTNVTSLRMYVVFAPTGSPTSADIRGQVTATLQRFTYTTAASAAGTTGATPRMYVAWNNGTAVDFTLRFGLPQLETGAITSSPIRTTNAAVTRAADVLTVPVPNGMALMRITRESGVTDIDVTEADIATVPNDPSPVQSVIVSNPAWGGDLGAHWHHNLDQLVMPPPGAPETIPPGTYLGDRATALNTTPTRMGVYAFEEEIDLGLVSSVSMVAILEGYAMFLGIVIATWLPMASAVPLAQGASGNGAMVAWRPIAMAVPLAMGASDQWDAHIEVRVSQDDATFGAWGPLKSALITGRRFQWRMIGTLYDLATTIRMVRCEVWVEIALRNVGGSDAALDEATGLLTVNYVTPFLETPTVQITARQDLSPGGNIVLTESDAWHFAVAHRDASGAPATGGSIDYFIQGFGGGIPRVTSYRRRLRNGAIQLRDHRPIRR